MSMCNYHYYFHEQGNPVPASIPLLLIICILGLLGNLVAIFVIVILKEQKKSVTHWYIFQLALADTIFLGFLPFKVAETLCRGWIFPEWMCKANETVLFLNFYSSTLFLMIMSIDRFIAVCHPFSSKLQRFRKHRSAIIITCTTWVVSILLCIPVMLSSFVKGHSDNRSLGCTCQYEFSALNPAHVCNHEFCHLPRCFNVSEYYYSPSGSGYDGDRVDSDNDYIDYNQDFDINPTIFESFDIITTSLTKTTEVPEEKVTPISEDYFYPGCGVGLQDRHAAHAAFISFNFAVMFLLPLMVMIACYGMIIHRLSTTQMKPTRLSSTSSNEVPLKRRKSSSSSSRSKNSRKRVTVMCATLVSCFTLCWLPFHAVKLANWIGVTGTEPGVCNRLKVIGTLLAFLNSALNPYLYTFLGTNFSRRVIAANSTLMNIIRRHNSSSSAFVPAKPNHKTSRHHSASMNTKFTRATKNSSLKHSQDIFLQEPKRQAASVNDDGIISKM